MDNLTKDENRVLIEWILHYSSLLARRRSLLSSDHEYWILAKRIKIVEDKIDEFISLSTSRSKRSA